MRRLLVLFILSFLTATSPHMFALAQSVSSSSPCVENHRRFAPQNPVRAKNGDIVPGQTTVQMKISWGQNNNIEVIEHPQVGKDVDYYNSVIVAHTGNEMTEFPLGKLVESGAALRLTESALVCGSSDGDILFLAFETAATGSVDGFVRISFSSSGVLVKAFPLSQQGRIVVSRADPRDVQLWSATDDDQGIVCDACKKIYAVRKCHVSGEAVECKRAVGPGTPEMPDKFAGARIVLH